MWPKTATRPTAPGHVVGVPEVRLICAILELAVHDLRHGYPDARRFIQSPDFDYWCDAIGLDATAVRQHLRMQ